MLEVDRVSASYGPVPALFEVVLEVAGGEVVALVGGNGSGRTTLLRAVSGLLRTTAGRVLLDGVPLTGLSPARVVGRGVAHVPQGRGVFARMSVRDNLELGAHVLAPAAAGPAVSRVLARFPVLAERSLQAAGTLSGGEQLLLALGRALVSGPRLLLLDEPSTGLAPLAVQDLLRVVREVRDEGVAVLLVDQAETALPVADRAYVLEAGAVVLHGTGRDLLADDDVRRAHLGG